MSEENKENAGTEEPMEVEENKPVVEEGSENSNDENVTANGRDSSALSKSALQDNIESKGKNAYYFAHAHKATGPKWDGKIEPKLLSKQSTSELEDNTSSSLRKSMPSFDIHKSNITSYAFLDEGKKVKIYVEMEGIGERCTNDDDITLSHTESSFCLVVKNYNSLGEEEKKEKSDEKCLAFGRLHGSIQSASFRKKKDRVIITLLKKEEKGWPSIGAKGDPMHEMV
mmetsp:Transcript_12297/g.17983  ORF Transcript_12297/g.17983 Transcript_12297/m.17983 type:complete len:227 (+) Transcript_12297:185-865(+)